MPQEDAGTRAIASALATLEKLSAVVTEREAVLTAMSQHADALLPMVTRMDAALRKFINDINTAGGIVDEDGGKRIYPAGDPDWTALATTYLHACEALGLAPQIQYE